MNLLTLVFGCMLILLGLTVEYKANRVFARTGKGTLAPWAPKQRFVVVGLYQYVRNPMILGVLLTLVGEAIVFGSTLIFLWTFIFWVMNHIWFIKWEEPNLERRFGTEYRVYKKHVRRWILHLSPWTHLEKKRGR